MTTPDHDKHIEELRCFLRAQTEIAKMGDLPLLHGYRGLADFVEQNGQAFEWGPLPPFVERGIIKQCFLNCMQLAQRKSRFIYCEGYACSLIPVHHAWCYDLETGLIVDPTWPEPGSAYFGIPFDTLFAASMTARRGSYGILDYYEARWPLLGMERSEFIRELPPVAG
jgi:hypothetical protein